MHKFIRSSVRPEKVNNEKKYIENSGNEIKKLLKSRQPSIILKLDLIVSLNLTSYYDI